MLQVFFKDNLLLCVYRQTLETRFLAPISVVSNCMEGGLRCTGDYTLLAYTATPVTYM